MARRHSRRLAGQRHPRVFERRAVHRQHGCTAEWNAPERLFGPAGPGWRSVCCGSGCRQSQLRRSGGGSQAELVVQSVRLRVCTGPIRKCRTQHRQCARIHQYRPVAAEKYLPSGVAPASIPRGSIQPVQPSAVRYSEPHVRFADFRTGPDFECVWRTAAPAGPTRLEVHLLTRRERSRNMRYSKIRTIMVLVFLFQVSDAFSATAIRFGKLVDGSGKVMTNAIVVVDGQRIKAVGTSDSVIPPNSEIIDLSRFTGIPGLIDMH